MENSSNDRISIVIPVRDRWESLFQTLNSIMLQVGNPDYEVIIVDDGSKNEVPDYISNMGNKLKLIIIRQMPLGISAARNHGIRMATGNLILFIDSDCLLHKEGLKNLIEASNIFPDDYGFQLRLIANKNTMVGRMEHIRLLSLQENLQTAEGYIRYLNTAGFAIRRKYLTNHMNLFNTSLVRGEDTYLLYQLAVESHFPRYINNSIVTHQPELNLSSYLLKHFWVGYYLWPTRKSLQSFRPIWMSKFERIKFLSIIWQNAKGETADVLAFLLRVAVSYPLDLAGRFFASIVGLPPGKCSILGVSLDRVHLPELLNRVLQSAEAAQSMTLISVSEWPLLCSIYEKTFRNQFDIFDVCLVDGNGVAWGLLFLGMKCINKIDVRKILFSFCKELVNRKLKIGVVYDSEKMRDDSKNIFMGIIAENNTYICMNGEADYNNKADMMKQSNLNMVFVGMRQSSQQDFVKIAKNKMPNTVFWCLGDLLREKSNIAGRIER